VNRLAFSPSPPLLPALSFSFSSEWRAIELLRADKRETQFKLRLLAVVRYDRYYNVSVSRLTRARQPPLRWIASRSRGSLAERSLTAAGIPRPIVAAK